MKENTNSKCQISAIILLLFISFFCGCSGLTDDYSKKYTLTGDSLIDSLQIEADKLYQKDRYEDALVLFNQIIQLDSTNGWAHFSLAYCYSRIEELEKSSYHYRKSIKLGYQIDKCYFSLGCNNLLAYNDSLAIVYFEKSIDLNFNVKESEEFIHFLKGRIYFKHYD